MNDQIARKVFRIDPSQRLAAEAQRVEEIKARAAIPSECGDAIPSAPGRGAFVMYTPRETVRTESGAIRVRPAGYAGRRGLRVGDAFDKMEGAALKARKGKEGAEPIFTVAQVTAGREYAALWEKYQKAGIRCASLEAQSPGSSGGSYMDAVIADGQRLDRMIDAIGTGWAMKPSRAWPHRDRRKPIGLRELVDQVCLHDETLTDVLQDHGWEPNGRNRAALREPLCAALDRIYDRDRR